MVVFLILFLAPLALRPRIESRHYLSQARALAQTGAREEAIDSYRKAISWRSPFDSAPAEASKELLQLALSTDTPEAVSLHALDQLRRGLVSSRSWIWAAPGSWSGVTDEEINSVISEREPRAPATVREAHPPTVHVEWQAVAQLAFWAWIVTLVRAIWLGFDAQGRPIKSLLRLAVPPLALLACWLMALSRA
jgi:hypothetical protein